MNYKNGKQARIGDRVIGLDDQGNPIGGTVAGFLDGGEGRMIVFPTGVNGLHYNVAADRCSSAQDAINWGIIGQNALDFCAATIRDGKPSTSPKSLGQIAYEAYCADTCWKSIISGASLPTWAEQNPRIQQAWEAAASAVPALHHPGFIDGRILIRWLTAKGREGEVIKFVEDMMGQFELPQQGHVSAPDPDNRIMPCAPRPWSPENMPPTPPHP